MSVALSPNLQRSDESARLVEWYDDFTQLIENKNLDQLTALLADDYTSIPLNGVPGSRDEWIDQVKREFSVWNYIDVHFTVEKIRLTGNGIITYVTKRLVSKPIENSTLRKHYYTVSDCREVLIHNNNAWLLKETESIKRSLTIDGAVPAFEELQEIGALMQTCTNPYG